jgi:hypothetical protein
VIGRTPRANVGDEINEQVIELEHSGEAPVVPTRCEGGAPLPVRVADTSSSDHGRILPPGGRHGKGRSALCAGPAGLDHDGTRGTAPVHTPTRSPMPR